MVLNWQTTASWSAFLRRVDPEQAKLGPADGERVTVLHYRGAEALLGSSAARAEAVKSSSMSSARTS